MSDWPIIGELPIHVVPSMAFGGSAGGAFYFLKWLTEWRSGRSDRREERLDRIQDDLLNRLLKDVALLKEESAQQGQKLASLQADLIECERKHGIAEAKIVELEGILNAAGIARQQAQQIIAKSRMEDKA